jgi:hypothetical protein
MMNEREARQSLELIDQAMAHTRRAIAHAGTGYFFVVWGFVWLAGFLGNELLPSAQAGYLWLALDLVGILGSALTVIRLSRRVRSPEGRRAGLRVGILWLFLVAYGGLLFWVAQPSPERAVVFISVFVAFGYCIAGLSISTPLLLTGLAITVLTLLVWLVFPAVLGLSLAVIGGGGMIVVGLMMLRAWE